MKDGDIHKWPSVGRAQVCLGADDRQMGRLGRRIGLGIWHDLLSQIGVGGPLGVVVKPDVDVLLCS